MSLDEPSPGPAIRSASAATSSADRQVALVLLLVLAGFLAVGVAYGAVLGPISIAFNDPLHTNPVTSAGKALMREAGPLQFLAALAALLLLVVSVLLKGRARHIGLGTALVPSLYVVGYMLLETLMVSAWVVTLWGYSQSMAHAMAQAHETTLWPLGDWRIQLVTGAFLVLVGTGFCMVALLQAAVSWRAKKV